MSTREQRARDFYKDSIEKKLKAIEIMVGFAESELKLSNPKKTKEERIIEYTKIAIKECKPDNYQKNDFQEFTEYWFESGTNQRKLRFEKEKSFNWSRRWNRWLNNKNNWNNEKRNSNKSKSRLTATADFEKVAKYLDSENGFIGARD